MLFSVLASSWKARQANCFCLGETFTRSLGWPVVDHCLQPFLVDLLIWQGSWIPLLKTRALSKLRAYINSPPDVSVLCCLLFCILCPVLRKKYIDKMSVSAKVSWEKVMRIPEISHFLYHLVLKTMQMCSQTASFGLSVSDAAINHSSNGKKIQPKTQRYAGFFCCAL